MQRLQTLLIGHFAYCCALLASAAPEPDDLLWSSPNFQITVKDLQLYLKPPITQSGEFLWGPPMQVERAITDLMTLRVLEQEANAANVMTEEEKQWVASYRVAMEAVGRYVSRQAMAMMEDTDWDSEAREFFLAHPDDFIEQETRTVRTFLLEVNSRTVDEALLLASELAPKGLSEEEFTRVVIENTEDRAAGDGLMENIAVGQTVLPFETAAFALREIGEISAPVTSQFGVHVIQLLGITPSRKKTFEEVKPQLIDELKQRRWNEYNAFLKSEPQRSPPPDVVQFEDNIRALLNYADEQTRAYQSGQLENPSPAEAL